MKPKRRISALNPSRFDNTRFKTLNLKPLNPKPLTLKTSTLNLTTIPKRHAAKVVGAVEAGGRVAVSRLQHGFDDGVVEPLVPILGFSV